MAGLVLGSTGLQLRESRPGIEGIPTKLKPSLRRGPAPGRLKQYLLN